MPARAPLRVLSLGRIRYREALALQMQIADDVANNRAPDTVLSLDHFPVYTIGKRNTEHNFKTPLKELQLRGVDVCHVARGGETTFHGPEQAVLYPIIRLRERSLGARRYVEGLEDVMIGTCGGYGVECVGRLKDRTGVWVGERKIGAIGVQISRGVTMHGLALNVSNDLTYFDHIVPCGIEGKEVTSLANEIRPRLVSFERVQEQLLDALCDEFGFDSIPG